jgi:hypothetical protein
LLGLIAALIAPRAGYNWRYVAASLAPALLLAAEAAAHTRWFGRVAGALLVTAMAFVTAVNAVSPGREDNPGAVRHLVASYRPGDAVLVHTIRNPDGSRSLATWDYYAARDAEPGRARAIPVRPLAAYADVLRHPRVWVFLRPGFPDDARRALEAAFPVTRRFHFGADRRVVLFTR